MQGPPCLWRGWALVCKRCLARHQALGTTWALCAPLASGCWLGSSVVDATGARAVASCASLPLFSAALFSGELGGALADPELGVSVPASTSAAPVTAQDPAGAAAEPDCTVVSAGAVVRGLSSSSSLSTSSNSSRGQAKRNTSSSTSDSSRPAPMKMKVMASGPTATENGAYSGNRVLVCA